MTDIPINSEECLGENITADSQSSIIDAASIDNTLSQWLIEADKQQLNSDPLDGEVSANYAALLLRFLKQQTDIDTERLLHDTHLSHTALSDPAAKIDIRQYAQLVNLSLQYTGNPALGLEHGLRLNIATHGLLGYAVMSCPSFKKATELARKYVQIRNQLILISYEGSATDASLNSESSESTASTENTKICFDVSKIDPNLYRFEIDASLSSLYIVLQELFGGTEGILEIHFSYPAPQDLSLYQQIFDVPLVFNQSKSGICINTAVLQGTGRLTDATVSLVAEQQCEKLLSQLTRKDQSLANQIRQLLLQSPKSLPTQEAISQQLNMTSRTLARKLAKEGVTYKEITEDLRKRIALKCIENTQWSVEDIATILKYSDAANFSRAFKRWTGLYPGQYRKTIEQ